MIKKLHRKFILVSMLAVASVLFVIIAAINILNYRSVVSDADHMLNMMASVKNNPPGGLRGPSKPGSGFKGNLPFDSRSFLVVLDKYGSEVSVDMRDTVSTSDSRALSYARKIYKSGKTRGFIHGYRYLSTKGSDETQTTIIFVDCSGSLANFRAFLLISILVSLSGLLMVFILIFFFSRRIIRPVEESYKKQKRFITDAGHELKTPLAIIDADASVLEMETGKNEWISDLKKQTKRMADLTNDFLYLARMDEGSAKLVMMDFPLSDIVTETSQSFRSRALLSSKTFEIHAEPMINFFGDEKAIRQLMGILLDNAIKYSNDGGTIRVSLSRKNHKIILSVYNTADHIDKNELPRIFDRFYRSDASRNSESGGYGIGLSMALAIVKAHKGKIEALSADEKSITIIVTLPLKAHLKPYE